jgi:enamine deaminase RidA (YjgF/YER057c/UK114 family)
MGMERVNFAGGSAWESVVGYSRAVKVGDVIEVSGTVAVDVDGTTFGVDDPYAQTRFIIEKIGKVLEDAGASLQDIVRTRMFVTQIHRWQEYGKAHGEFFSLIRPSTSMIGVKELIDPAFLIEIEATAIINRG